MADILDRLKAALADRYRIDRELGSGGMATVYLAQDLRHERQVAVKVFRPELAAALGTERFFREIKITAKLSHPHILPLLDSGEADGSLYYVMPLVEGDSLRDKLNRDKQLSVDEALKITSQVASALSYAHSRDIVHRDIKPENVLFQAGEVVVADFGIALAVDSAGGTRLTETGFSLGTPAYMSPEQVSGEQQIDGRSDVYSLACVLYEMLAGDPPFVASSPRAVLAKHMTDPAPPIATVRSSVPLPVAAALTKALGKAAVDRFESATAFSQALFAEAKEAGLEIKSIVVLPFDNMSPDPSDSYLGDGLTEELTTRLSKLSNLRVISRNSAMALKERRMDTRAITRKLNVQYVLEGSVRKAGNAVRITAQLIEGQADRHMWAETYSGTIDDVFGMQEEVSRAIVDALRVELSPDEVQRFAERPFQNLQALQFYMRAMGEMWLMSGASLDRSLEITERGLATVGENDLLLVARGMVFFQYVNTMSKAPRDFGSYLEEAQQCADRALAINPRSGPAHQLQGIVHWNLGSIPAALSYWEGALQVDPNNPEAHMWLGYERAAGGYDLVGAQGLLERMSALDPLTPVNSGALGYIDWFNGEFDAALNKWNDWVHATDEARSPMRVLIAYFRAASGDIDEAVRTIDRVMQDTPLHLLASLGAFLKHAWRGKKPEALAAVTEDLEEAARWDDIWPLLLASGYAVLGELDRSFYWLDHAIEWGISNVCYLEERDPFLANLRSRPEFREAVAKAGSVTKKHAAVVGAA